MLLTVERLEGCFASLDLKLGIVDHKELLSTIKRASLNLSLKSPGLERMESLSEHEFLIRDFNLHQLDDF